MGVLFKSVEPEQLETLRTLACRVEPWRLCSIGHDVLSPLMATLCTSSQSACDYGVGIVAEYFHPCEVIPSFVGLSQPFLEGWPKKNGAPPISSPANRTPNSITPWHRGHAYTTRLPLAYLQTASINRYHRRVALWGDRLLPIDYAPLVTEFSVHPDSSASAKHDTTRRTRRACAPCEKTEVGELTYGSRK